MKTQYLNDIGITDQSIIDSIMAENGRDIEKAKKDYESLKSQIDDLKSQLSDRDTQLGELKKSIPDNEELTKKIESLEKLNSETTTNYENKLIQLQKNYAIESAVRDAKAKNIKAVVAQLDMDKITFEKGELKGLSEQLDSLKTGEDTSFLFGETHTPSPSGTQPNTPPTTSNANNAPSGKSFSDAIAAALKSNN